MYTRIKTSIYFLTGHVTVKQDSPTQTTMYEEKIMATKRRLFSKALGMARLQLDGKQVQDLIGSLVKLATMFDEFEIAQDVYALTLDNFDDIEAAGEYYDEVITKYGEARKEIIQFLQSDSIQQQSCFTIPPAFNTPMTSMPPKIKNTPPMSTVLETSTHPQSNKLLEQIHDSDTSITTSSTHTIPSAPATADSPLVPSASSTYIPNSTNIHSVIHEIPLRRIDPVTSSPHRQKSSTINSTYHKKPSKQYTSSLHNLKTADDTSRLEQKEEPIITDTEVGELIMTSPGFNTSKQRRSLHKVVTLVKKSPSVKIDMNMYTGIVRLWLILVVLTCLVHSTCTRNDSPLTVDHGGRYNGSPLRHHLSIKHAVIQLFGSHCTHYMIALLWKHYVDETISETYPYETMSNPMMACDPKVGEMFVLWYK